MTFRSTSLPRHASESPNEYARWHIRCANIKYQGLCHGNKKRLQAGETSLVLLGVNVFVCKIVAVVHWVACHESMNQCNQDMRAERARHLHILHGVST